MSVAFYVATHALGICYEFQHFFFFSHSQSAMNTNASSAHSIQSVNGFYVCMCDVCVCVDATVRYTVCTQYGYDFTG